MTAMIKLLVAIPTYKRPIALREAILSVLNCDTDAKYSILIAENDPVFLSGVRVTEQISEKYNNMTIQSIVVNERGISEVRNAIISFFLENTDYTHIFFLDDDQEIDTDCLSNLIDDLDNYNVDCVGCTVIPKFIGRSKNWIRENKTFSSPKTHGIIPVLTATNGFICSREAITQLSPPYFPSELNLSLGHDVVFFNKLKETGTRFARSNSALAFEKYDSDRTNFAWVLKRNYSGASAWAYIQTRTKSSPQIIIHGILNIIIGILTSILIFHNKKKCFEGFCRASRGAGQIMGAVNVVHSEYKNTLGS